MLRYFLLLLAVCPFLAFAQRADSLWEALPMKFDWQVLTLYTDPSSEDLYITALNGPVNGQDSSLVKWDGHQATLIQTPFDDGIYMVKHKDKLYISGVAYGPPAIYKLASFDGQSWTTLDLPQYEDASPISILDSNIVVAGYFDTIAGHLIETAALWDGASGWRDFYQIDTCMPGRPAIHAVLRYKGDIYVGGNIYAPNSITHIARFDGTKWKDVGGGMHGNGLSDVRCMLVWKDELYVAGEFFERDGSPGNCIARWDGQRWRRLGSGITQGGGEAAVEDMVVYHDNLYVVGEFSRAGQVSVNNIAKWDGTKWCSLNTDFDQGTPVQIEVAKGELYISGALWTINGDTVSNMAHWIGGDYTKECGPVEPTAVAERPNPDQTLLYPNPANNMLYTKRPDIQSLIIYDAAGKWIKTVTAAELKAGINIAHWPGGFYFAKAVFSDGVMLSSKFLKQ